MLRDAFLDDGIWVDPTRPGGDTGGTAGDSGQVGDGTTSDTSGTSDTPSPSDVRPPLVEGACVQFWYFQGVEPVRFAGVTVGESKDVVVPIRNCGNVAIGPLTIRVGGEHEAAYSIVLPPPPGSDVVAGTAPTYELALLNPGETLPVTVRFTPRDETSSFNCSDEQGYPILPWRDQPGFDVPQTKATLEVSAGVEPNRVSDAVNLVGVGRFVDEAGCQVGLTVLSSLPAVATQPVDLLVSTHPLLCYSSAGPGTWNWTRGGSHDRVESVRSDADPLRSSWTTYEAGLYTLVGTAWTNELCRSPVVMIEVDPFDGFAARLTWTHAGVTVPEPGVDARLELHVARLDPFPAGTAPPWRSSQWATWPAFPHKVHDGAEVDTWPGEPLKAIATVEFVKPGQRFAIGVAGLSWPIGPGDARPTSAEARLEIWVRGRLELTRTVTIEPDSLHDLARFEWRPTSGALFELVNGTD